jgi:hypothetical protein
MFFEKKKSLERGSNELLEHMCDLVIQNNELQEENQYLIDLNKYDYAKYEKLGRTLIINLIKKILQNNIFGINYNEEHQRILKE